MVSCIAFITLVLLEFPIVHTLIRKDKKPLAEKVENCALLIIPVMFAIYNIIYWLCLIYGWLFIISSTSLSIQHAWNWTNLSCVSFDISLRSSIQNYSIQKYIYVLCTNLQQWHHAFKSVLYLSKIILMDSGIIYTSALAAF